MGGFTEKLDEKLSTCQSVLPQYGLPGGVEHHGHIYIVKDTRLHQNDLPASSLFTWRADKLYATWEAVHHRTHPVPGA